MGMRYSLVTNKETTCTGRFPHELGRFFQAIGGYEENSEVSQVSELLKVDLGLFQDYDHQMADPEMEESFWKDVGQFEVVLRTFIDSIKEHQDYHKRVRYNQHPDHTEALIQAMENSGDLDSKLKYVEELRADGESPYPIDSGYLSEGRILNDLEDLMNTLACFRSQGVERVKLRM